MAVRRSLLSGLYLTAIAVLVVAAAACGRGNESQGPSLLREAQEAFVAGEFEVALRTFRDVAAVDAAGSEALVGVARSNQQLHQYEAAVAAYQSALSLDPFDSLAWEGYVSALYWDGVLRGNGSQLERVLDVAPRALVAAPENVQIYSHVLRTTAELGRLHEYVPLLEVVAEALPQHPVVRAELDKARLEQARRARDLVLADGGDDARLAAVTDELEQALRERLASGALGAGAAGEIYARAVGFDLIGEVAPSHEALEALERVDGGPKMAAPMRYEQFMAEWTAGMRDPFEVRLAVIDRWRGRFEPQWSDDGTHFRSILGLELDLMVLAARQQLASGAEGLQPELADRIAATGRRLGRMDTWRRAARYVETASVLAISPPHLVTAVQITAEGIDDFETNRPGLIHPGTPDTERQELRRRYLAVLMQLQGQALHNLGRDDEAEEILREAIVQYPAGAGYAVLGGLLLDGGRDAEAFDLLVAALAYGFNPGETALQEQTRAAALAAAASIGASTEAVDMAVELAAVRVTEERAVAIVADPLDTPAPDFELVDLDGVTWRRTELRGKVIVLNYWATWCGPCIAEMPYWEQLVEEFSDAADVVFLAISTDSDVAAVPRFLQTNGYDFAVALDAESAPAYGVMGVPAGFIIGKDGRIKYRSSGFPGPDRYLREMRLRIEATRRPGQ